MRGATSKVKAITNSSNISIHAPHARSDLHHVSHRPLPDISIHAPHARSDFMSSIDLKTNTIFQSTLLMRGATRRPGPAEALRRGYFNPRSSCEERHGMRCRSTSGSNFNPRSSCEERRWSGTCSSEHLPFQSTLLMRGATSCSMRAFGFVTHFNPRSSCEERHFQNDCRGIVQGISIHAPHARSDLFIKIASRILSTFQSTLLMRGATRMVHGSIECIRHFNPRSSCEERPDANIRRLLYIAISIHAPHARSDWNTDGYKW